MSLLDEMRRQAEQVRQQSTEDTVAIARRIEATETFARSILSFWSPLAHELAVVCPSLRRPFEIEPDLIIRNLKVSDFRVDIRHAMVRNREVTDYIVVLYEQVSDNPMSVMRSALEYEKTRRKLFEVGIEAKEEVFRNEDQRMVRCEFNFPARVPSGARFTFNHDAQTVQVRLKNIYLAQLLQADYPIDEITPAWLEELARLMIDQPNKFPLLQMHKIQEEAKPAAREKREIRIY
jgi:hypothetical protein